MPWQPGQSGNPSGKVAEKPFLEALRRAIKQDDSVKLRQAAEKLLDAAAAGEPWAIQHLADRVDGKPKQQSEISGPDGGPVRVESIERRIVDPSDAV